MVSATDERFPTYLRIRKRSDYLRVQNKGLTVHSAAYGAEGQVIEPVFAAFSPDGEQLVALTAPDVLSPRVLHAFAWEGKGLASEVEADLRTALAEVKRAYWR